MWAGQFPEIRCVILNIIWNQKLLAVNVAYQFAEPNQIIDQSPGDLSRHVWEGTDLTHPESQLYCLTQEPTLWYGSIYVASLTVHTDWQKSGPPGGPVWHRLSWPPTVPCILYCTSAGLARGPGNGSQHNHPSTWCLILYRKPACPAHGYGVNLLDCYYLLPMDDT